MVSQAQQCGSDTFERRPPFDHGGAVSTCPDSCAAWPIQSRSPFGAF